MMFLVVEIWSEGIDRFCGLFRLGLWVCGWKKWSWSWSNFENIWLILKSHQVYINHEVYIIMIDLLF